MRTIHTAGPTILINQKLRLGKIKGYNLLYPTTSLGLQDHNLHSSTSQITGNTKKGRNIILHQRQDTETFVPGIQRNLNKWEISLVPRKFSLLREEKKLLGWHPSELRVKSIHQQLVNFYKSPSQNSNWVLWGSDILQSNFYHLEMVLSKSQTEERECTYN